MRNRAALVVIEYDTADRSRYVRLEGDGRDTLPAMPDGRRWGYESVLAPTVVGAKFGFLNFLHDLPRIGREGCSRAGLG